MVKHAGVEKADLCLECKKQKIQRTGFSTSQGAEWVSHAIDVQKNPYCNVTVSGAQ